MERFDNGSLTSIYASSGTVTNNLDDIGFLVRVTRTSEGVWTLYTSTLPSISGERNLSTDVPSSSNANVNQGSITNNTYSSFDNGYFIIEAIYSSVTDNMSGFEFDQFYFDTNANSTLPVELTSFNAECKMFASPNFGGQNVELNWQTATEVNNYGFEVERAAPLNLLQRETYENPNWDAIGFVQGSGNSNSPKRYSFVDRNAISKAGGTIQYRLKQIDFNGKFEYSDVVEVTIGEPAQFALEQNYPNPFNPTTTIKYSIPVEKLHAASLQPVTLKVFDILGREVATLVNEQKAPGNCEVTFDASQTERGRSMASGVYIYQLRAGDFIQTKKLLLMK